MDMLVCSVSPGWMVGLAGRWSSALRTTSGMLSLNGHLVGSECLKSQHLECRGRRIAVQGQHGLHHKTLSRNQETTKTWSLPQWKVIWLKAVIWGLE